MHFEKKRDKSINEYLNITLVLFYLLLVILIFRAISSTHTTYFEVSTYQVIFLFFLLGIITFINIANDKLNFNSLNIDIILFSLYLLITTLLLYIENENLFKIVLLMPVVVSGIKYSKKISFYITGATITCLFVVGLLKDFSSIDADIVLSGIIILFAWLFGSMTEKERDIRKELERLATHDELTDIYNHRSFQYLLEKDMKNAEQEKKSVSLLFLDIDYFKYYNDAYGHQKGDEVLKKIAYILKRVIGANGICARYGGEEFAVILPGFSIKDARKIGEKIRISIESQKISGSEVLPKGKLTASIGIAEYPLNAENKEKLIQKADEALYKAKFVSKNKVETYYSVFDELSMNLRTEEQELFNSIRALTMVIHAKDRYTFGHSERTMKLAKRLAEKIGLEKSTLKDLEYGALLHDIGKIEISREILNKSAKLNRSELEIIEQHPQWGADIIRPILTLKEAQNIILYHHENFDGTGYPEGLGGEEIPIGARILRIVDSFDAMTTNRPYKDAMSKEQAFAELKRLSGFHYDPLLVEKFIVIMK